MNQTLSPFRPVDGFAGVYSAQKGNLRCTAIVLATGGLCLYSPVLGLGDAERESLDAIGTVTHLLAPNHYHHKGLSEYLTVFPMAKLCCTSTAAPRLQKQTGLSFDDLKPVEIDLPEGMRFVEPHGLKTGEVWVQSTSKSGGLWIVTDAFCGAKGPIGAVVSSPDLLGTFPKFGLKDRDKYLAWLSHQLEINAPKTIVPCHGSVISGLGIGDMAQKLVENL